MDIHKLAKPLEGSPVGLHYGLDPPRVAAELRELAAQIEKGEIVLQTAVVYGRADSQEFTLQALVLKYVQRKQPGVVDGKQGVGT